jgi:nicotinamidase-related amidase
MREHVLHTHHTALLITDMINTLDFPGSENLLKTALPAAIKTARLKKRAKKANVPVLYVNDNFGQWRSDWAQVYEDCAAEKAKGKELARLLKPEDDDYFVLKPKHSGFFSTSLEVLLRQLKAKNLIVTGIAADICVLFTVHDAYMREYSIKVPSDCVAANTPQICRQALKQMREVFKIPTPLSGSIKF